LTDVARFIAATGSFDKTKLNNPYYIVPDGEVGQQAFAVIREAIRKEGMVALGRIVFTSREHVMMGITLRYPYEVRKEQDYFDEIPEETVPKDMLDLASHIVATKRGHFEPEKFDDRYEDALKELLRKKQHGEKIERPRERIPSNVVNLMEALHRSVEAESDRGESRKAASTATTQARPTKKSGTAGRKKKAG
jgi:DNA end-binding protein Ku